MPNSIHWCLNVQPSGSKKNSWPILFFVQNGISSIENTEIFKHISRKSQLPMASAICDCGSSEIQVGKQLVRTAYAKWTMGGSFLSVWLEFWHIFLLKKHEAYFW